MKNLFFFLVLVPVLLFGQTNSTAFNTFLNLEQTKYANIGFEVCNLSTNQVVTSYNSEKLMSPASLQKLLTTSVALSELGEDFQFKTEMKLNGTIENGVFLGILKIIASGDPSLEASFITEIIAFLKANKISKFVGKIDLDESKYSNLPNQTWLLEDVANYYGTTAFGFNFMQNTYLLNFAQSAENLKPKLVSTTPNMQHLSFDNRVVSKGKKDYAYILGVPFSTERKIVGSIPAGTGTFSIKGAMDNPATVFKNLLLKKFKEQNIEFVSKNDVSKVETELSKIIYSPRLTDIVKETNLKSNNLYAEALLNALAIKKYGFASEENGINVLKDLFASKESKLYDGSGLSRKNKFSTDFLMQILKQNKDNLSFKNSLGVSGVSGTMVYFNSEKVYGKIKAKSGSADGILNYAGYFENSKGQQFAFTFIVNDFSGSTSGLRKEMVKVLEAFL